MTQVKICGITSYDDAQVAVEAGADMLGFIFYPPSPRYVEPERVRLMVERLPAGVKAVGVFVNETAETVSRIAAASGIEVVQLHGEEQPILCHALSWPVIKAFRFNDEIRPEMMADYTVEAFLVEGFNRKLYGGGRGGGGLASGRDVARLWQYYPRRWLDA